MIRIGYDGIRDFFWKGVAILKPRFVAKERIRADANDGNSIILEVFQEFLEAEDFGRSDEGEIEWIEIQDVPLALVVVAADFLFFAADMCGTAPMRGGLAN